MLAQPGFNRQREPGRPEKTCSPCERKSAAIDGQPSHQSPASARLLGEARRSDEALWQRPFYGRSALLSDVTIALDSPGANAVLMGGGGAGKTSLGVRALQTLAERDPQLRILRLEATEATQHTPLGVFAGALPELPAEQSSRPEAIGKALIHAHLHRGALESPAPPDGKARGRSIRLIVHLDDAQHLDQMSEAVMSYLVSRVDVRVLLTCRTAPGLSAALVRAWRDGALTRIEVPHLTLAEASEFASARLPGRSFSDETLENFHRVTGGNVLFLGELLRSLEATDAFETRQGRHVWTGPIPEHTSLHDLLRAEIAGLTHEQRNAFEIVALCAPVSIRLIRDQVPDRVLDSLVATGLISVETGSDQITLTAALTHPIFGESITSLLTPLQIAAHYRALYSDAIARHATASSSAREAQTGPKTLVWRGELPELLTAVWWGLRAGCEVPVPLLETAFHYGQFFTDYPFRLRVTSAILSHPDATLQQQAEALVNRINAHHYTRNPAGIATDLPRCVAALNALAPSLVRAQLVSDLAALVTQSQVKVVGQWEHALDTIDWAEQRIAETVVDTAAPIERNQLRGLQARISVTRCILLSYTGEFARSHELQQRVWADPAASPHLLQLLSTTMFTLGLRGDAKRSRTLAQKHLARSVLAIRDSPNAVGEGLASWCIAAMFTGQLREASTIFGVLNAAIARNPGNVRIPRSNIAGGQGLLDVFEGNWAAAIQHLSLALDHGSESDDEQSACLFSAALALAQAAGGNLDGYIAARDKARTSIDTASRLMEIPCRYFLLLASLHGSRARAQFDAQIAEATDLAASAEASGFALIELRALHVLAYLSPRELTDEQLARVRTLASKIDAPIAAPLQRSVEHIVAGGTPHAGDAGRQLARRGVFLPSAPVAVLTGREQQLAEMLALGYSTKQIAKRLVLSKRTIDSHTSRIFQKLHINSRDDIGEALDRFGD